MFFANRWRHYWLAATVMVLQCGGPSEARVETVAQPATTLQLRLDSLTGFRDGGRFASTASFSGAAGTLTMEMNFKIGVPTVLTGGAYRFESSQGSETGEVQSSSLTFLGGQSDRPNLGGVFLLLSRGVARYRVVIPTMETERASRKRGSETPFQPETRN